MKKKPFLLFEILLALFIIELFAIPLMKKPIESFREEVRLFSEAEGEKLADKTFLEIEEKLYKNEIPWSALPQPGEKRTFSLEPIDLEIFGFEKKKIARKVVLQCDKRAEKKEGERLYRLLKVKIEFTPALTRKKYKNGKAKPYQFKVVVQKLPSSPTSA